MSDHPDLNAEARARWGSFAEFWDERMGATGNHFHLTIVRPAVERLLGDVAGQAVLEIACGNGLFARRLVELGAQVVATDGAPEMLERARAHPATGIDYRLIDAADPGQLAALGERPFDAVVCNMALMDMADIRPLAAAIPSLLKPDGRFVFSTTHPCFNRVGTRFVHELEEVSGELEERRGVVITGYATATVAEGVAIFGQPVKQLYFDRPLGDLLGAFFRSGLVLDGLQEPTFPPRDAAPGLTWDVLPEIPPVLAARLRRA